MAYFISQREARTKAVLIYLVTLPFWVSMIVRVYAWITILGNDGVIVLGLKSLGIIDNIDSFLFNDGAMLVGLVYSYVPLMILPVFASVEKLDGVFIEVSHDLYVWSDSIAPELITKFETETGTKVKVDGYNSNEDLLTKLQAGATGYDVMTPSQHFAKIIIDSGLAEDIDANQLPAFKQVNEKWRGQWWDPSNDYSIPAAYGTAGFTVNTDQYKGPADSWKVLFEPGDDLKGKIAMLGAPDEVIGAAQLYLGVPYCSEDPAEMKKVLDLLLAQKPAVKVYSSDNIENRIGGGEVAAHFWWDGNSLKTKPQRWCQDAYAEPKEGLVGWLDSFMVPKGAKTSITPRRSSTL